MIGSNGYDKPEIKFEIFNGEMRIFKYAVGDNPENGGYFGYGGYIYMDGKG
jgi:hypothetical protein